MIKLVNYRKIPNQRDTCTRISRISQTISNHTTNLQNTYENIEPGSNKKSDHPITNKNGTCDNNVECLHIGSTCKNIELCPITHPCATYTSQSTTLIGLVSTPNFQVTTMPTLWTTSTIIISYPTCWNQSSKSLLMS